MTVQKRLFDLVFVILLLPLLIPIGLIIAVLILLKEGRPIFYVSERMRAPDRAFWLWKFRTMTVVDQDGGASGGHKAARITRLGRILRRTHADEIPQALNVIRGDLSFVGPRPPLRLFVERFPEVYDQVLQSRPGLTGMASVFFSKREDALLKDCKDAGETDAVYVRRCIPRKARLDLIYQKNQSFGLDLWLIWVTAARIFGLPGARRKTGKSG